MDIELLHVSDCPHLSRARMRVEQALADTGVSAVVTEHRVDSAEEAKRRGMNGSPTVLVDGVDVDPTSGEPGSLACRLYDDGTGFDGAPSVTRIVEHLSRAQQAESAAYAQMLHKVSG